MILFSRLTDELVLLTLEYFDCESLSLACKISDTFNMLCETNKFIKIVRKKVHNETGFLTNMMSFDRLLKLCPYKRKYISAGFNHSLITTRNNQVYRFGHDQTGQLNTPTLIPGLDNIIRASAGNNYSLFLRSDKQIYELDENIGGNIKTPTLMRLYYIISISAGYVNSMTYNLC